MMKKHNLLGICITALVAATCPFISQATIYLMKGDKVVAEFQDDAVDYITFDEPTTPGIPVDYDVDTRSYFLNSNYYGDTQSKSGYNYAMQCFDLPADEKGFIPTDAVYYSLYLNGPEPADKEKPFIREGTYRLRNAGTGEYAIISELSTVRDKATTLQFQNAELKVTKNGTKWKYEFTAVAENSKIYHTVYDGVPESYDQSLTWLDTDEHIQDGTVEAFYLSQDEDLTGNGNNITIRVAENGYNDGWLVKPCNYLTIIGNVDMDEKGNILPGTWTVHEGDISEKNTLMSGRCVNFGGMSMPAYTHLEKWTSEHEVSVGLITSGVMTATQSKTGMTFTYDFTTDRGQKVSGIFKGPIKVQNHPYEESVKLENDYTLDIADNGVHYSPRSWSGEISLEVYRWDDMFQYLGDRLELILIPQSSEIELKPGVYKVNEDSASVGKIVPGTFYAQEGYGEQSVFMKFSKDEPGKILKGCGINGGQVEVKKNADETWTFIFDLLDNQDSPKHITGTWTGKLTDL